MKGWDRVIVSALIVAALLASAIGVCDLATASAHWVMPAFFLAVAVLFLIVARWWARIGSPTHDAAERQERRRLDSLTAVHTSNRFHVAPLRRTGRR